MDFEIRELKTPEELEEVVRLEMEVGGLPERHATSPITLKVLTLDYPRVGYALGAFEDGRLVGFSLSYYSQEPGTIFGFMLAVDPASQNSGAGMQLLQREWEIHRSNGIKRVCWTYEPMEAKNAHLYLNKMGARCVRYIENYYYIHSGLHAGLPQDRFLVERELDLEVKSQPRPIGLAEALERYPVARPDNLPQAERVLVEVPYKMHELLPKNPEAAEAFRRDTRAVFVHYINQKGYEAVNLLSGQQDGETKAYYLVQKD